MITKLLAIVFFLTAYLISAQESISVTNREALGRRLTLSNSLGQIFHTIILKPSTNSINQEMKQRTMSNIEQSSLKILSSQH